MAHMAKTKQNCIFFSFRGKIGLKDLLISKNRLEILLVERVGNSKISANWKGGASNLKRVENS